MLRFIKRKPIIRWFAKKRFLRLQKKFNRAVNKWAGSQSNMHLATLRLWAAKIKYYESCFLAWGKYRPEFCFDEKQSKKYNKELESLNIPFDYSQYNRTYTH
jgi:hypothetical protein